MFNVWNISQGNPTSVVRDGAKKKCVCQMRGKNCMLLTNAYEKTANKNGQLNVGNVP